MIKVIDKMTELQNKLLEMMCWLHDFMEEHHIRYYIIAGTMLGAARHEGFIPWDDDLDIAVPRKDYDLLIELLKKPVGHYVIESPKYSNSDFTYNFSKFYDINTTMIEKLKKKVVRGVYIDIFPLDGIGEDYESAIKNYKHIDRLNMILTTKTATFRKGRKIWKNVATLLGYITPLNANKLAKKIDKESALRNFDDCNYVGVLPSTYRYKDIIRRDIFGNPRKYPFEGHNFYGPENYNEYLTHIYGDWKKLPPKEKQFSAHDFIYMDLNQSYLK